MKNRFYPEIAGKFGFGCMRFPVEDEKIDVGQVKQMVDCFLEAGFNYFDTARPYHGGMSETVLRQALTGRYPRDRYILTNKLSSSLFKAEEDIRPLFMKQLEECGVEYFDFYLLHAQNARNYEQYKACRAYEIVSELKKEGYIRHVGLSFHDTAEVLEAILDEHPEVEVVQLQFNYLDFDDPCVQSRKCYEVCEKRNIPVIVMEPVKGGTLADIGDEAKAVFAQLSDASPASYALRFAAGFENVMMVLSGMSSIAQMRDNISSMKDFKPLSKEECEAVNKVAAIITGEGLIGCTGCRYCTELCPKQIPIPKIFECMNSTARNNKWLGKRFYEAYTAETSKASDCIKCGKCEHACPQKLPIRELLEKAVGLYEEKAEN